MMKKWICMLLAILMCASLCACGKSEAATAYEVLVNEIGTVSLDSEEAIVNAEEAYKDLSSEDKNAVADSYHILKDKRKEYDTLVAEAQAKAEQEARVNAVIALVDAIGDVTLDSEAAIIAAEEAYNNLSEEDKAMMADAAKKLSDSRAAFDSAVAEQQAMHAAEVTTAIEAIGTVSLESKETIKTARTKYDALTDAEKQLVTNLDILEAAEATYHSLWEAEKQKIITEYSKKFEIDSDPIQGISRYMHENMPYYIDSRCYIIPYIGVSGNNEWICIRYNYTADSWIFWENLTIMVDGVKYYKYVGYYDTVRDNDTEVWEYWDECLNINQAMDSDEIKMLEAIANSTETIIRFQGDNYHYDLYVSSKDKQMIRDTLKLYEAMLG